MNEPSDRKRDWKSLREKVIGLGEESIRKSYYPELQQRLSELQESEARFRAIFEQAPLGIAVIESYTGQFRQINPRYCAIAGRTQEEMLTLDFRAITYHDDLEANLENMKRLVEGEIRFFNMEKRIVRPDNAIVWVSLTAVPMWGESETPTYHIAMLEDITGRKRAEEEKRKFYRETILSATDGKLCIADPGDLEPFIARTQINMDINKPSDLAIIRGKISSFCTHQGIEGDRLDDFMIGVGEAITNALKHGGSGIAWAGADGNSVWVGVADNGPGIESLILPKAILRRGFSTKPSLGLGYSIMIDVADRIILNTESHGTTVILMKNIRSLNELQLDNIPDTWVNPAIMASGQTS